MAVSVAKEEKMREKRDAAFLGWAVVFGFVFIVHIWGYEYQK